MYSTGNYSIEVGSIELAISVHRVYIYSLHDLYIVVYVYLARSVHSSISVPCTMRSSSSDESAASCAERVGVGVGVRARARARGRGRGRVRARVRARVSVRVSVRVILTLTHRHGGPPKSDASRAHAEG